MNIFNGLLLVGFGGFLMALKVDNFGDIGNIVLRLIGWIICMIGFNYLNKHRLKRVKHASGKQ